MKRKRLLFTLTTLAVTTTVVLSLGTFFSNKTNALTEEKLLAAQDKNVYLKSDGTLLSWGYGDYCSMGDGLTSNRSTPVEVTMKNIRDVALGNYHVVALDNDGNVWTWGRNYEGELGNGRTYWGECIPQKIEGLGTIKSVAAGVLSSYALTEDGRVWVWGYNTNGQLGDGTTLVKDRPVLLDGIDHVEKLFAGENTVVAIKSDDTVWVWGNGSNSQNGLNGSTSKQLTPVQIPNFGNVDTVSIGGATIFAKKKDGTLWGWGGNYDYQLGQGTTGDKKVPVQIGTWTNVKKIGSGTYHGMAILEDGRTFVWGNNRLGQVGNGQFNTKQTTPVEITSPTNIDLIDGGSFHTVAKTTDGRLYGWGSNSYGQTGNGRHTNELAIQNVPITNVKSISAGYDDSYALKNDGTVWAWGKAWDGQIGNTGVHQATPIQVTGISNVSVLKAGGQHALALKTDGTVWAWGYNYYGELGNGTTANNGTPVQVKNLTGIIGISAGGYHSLALKSDGTVWAWGHSDYSQTGQDTSIQVSTPVQIQGLNNIIKVESGFYHNIALRSDGSVLTWGYNGYGELGDGTTTERGIPYQVSEIKNAVDIYASGYNTYVKTADGRLWAWGRNGESAVGDGTATSRSKPVKITAFSNPKMVNARNLHALAIDQNNDVWGWGYNSYGQLGTDDSFFRQATPIKLPDFGKAQQVIAGGAFSLVLKEDGTVVSVGDNTYGQLGNGEQLGYVTRPVETVMPSATYADFTKENAYVQVPYHASQNVGNQFTFEAMIRPTALGTMQRILEKQNEFMWALEQGEVQWAIMSNGNWEWHDTGYFVPTNQWTHIAITYDGTNVRFYFNGQLKDTEADTTGGALTANTNDVFIGSTYTKTNNFKGYIKEVRMWNTVRTQADILGTLNKRLTGTESGLQGDWVFDNITTNRVYDLTGHAAPGNMIGMNTLSTNLSASDVTDTSATLTWDLVNNATSYELYRDDVLVYSGSQLSFQDTGLTSGKTYTYSVSAKNQYGESLKSTFTLNAPANNLAFDGVNDYLLVKESSVLKSPDRLTFEAWVNPKFYGKSSSKKPLVGDNASSSILTYTSTTGNYQGTIWFEYRNNGQLDVYIRNISDTSMVGTIPMVPVDKWSHIAATYDSTTGRLKVFLNGTLTSNTLNASYGKLKAGKDILFGTGKGGGYADYFEGSIAEVRMWNIARADADIKNDMYKTLNGNETGLIGNWLMDYFTTAKTFDQTDYNNHAVGVGFDQPPTDLQLSGLIGNSATFTWAPVSKAQQYELRRDGTPIYTGNGTAFEDSTRVNNKRYTYAIVARSPKGESVPSSIVAPPSYSVTFDGVNDYVDFGANYTNLSGAKTFEFWINPMKNGNNPLLTLKKEDNPNGLITTIDDGGGVGAIRILQNSTEIGRLDGVLSYDRWQHLALSDNGTTINVYKNGELVGTIAATLNFSSIATPKRLQVAHGYTSNSEQWYKNTLSEFRIWNKALSQVDIQNTMNQELNGSEAGLVGYFKFDELATGKVYDHSTNGYHGMMYGFSEAKTNLKITNQTAGSVSFSWTAIPTATSYRLTRDGVTIYEGSAFSYTDSTINASERYRYSVTAINENGESLYDTLTVNGPTAGLYFDGYDNIDTGDITSLLPNKLSVETWIKTKEKSGNYTVISKYPKSYNDWQVVLKDGYLYLEGRDGTTVTQRTPQNTTFLANDQWHHVVATVDGSLWKVYVDGQLESQYDTRNASPNIDNDVKLFIGSRNDGTNKWKGTLTDVRLYNRVLTAGEATEHYKGTYTNETNLAAVFQPDPITTSLVYNQVDAANNGIVTGVSSPDVHLKGIVLTTNSIRVDWDDIPNVTEYQLKRGDTLVYSGTTSEYKDSNLTTGYLYNYTLIIKTTKGESSAIPLTVSTANDYLTFDGVDDKMTMPDLSSIQNSFTYEFWANPLATHEIDAESATGTGGTSGQKFVIGAKNRTNTGEAGVGVSMGTNGISVYEHATSHMPPLLVYQGSITKMTHVAIVMDNKVPKLYLDGVLVKTGVASTKIPVVSDTVGSGLYGSFQGQINDVAIWKTARTQSDIQNSMQNGVNKTDSNLAGYWDFDELTTGKTFDQTGQGNVGTMSGFTLPNTLIAKDITEDSVRIEWSVMKSAENYELKKGTLSLYTGIGTSVGDTGLSPDTNYTYSLTAKNNRGESQPIAITMKTKKNPLKSLSFNGIDQYASKSSFVKLTGSLGITMEFWMKSTDTNEGILSYATASSDDDILIYDSSSLKIKHGTNEYNTEIALNDGQWHHIAVSWRWSDGAIWVYENGSLRYYNWTFPDGDTPDPIGSFVLGGDQMALDGKLEASRMFKGSLGEIRIWDKQRTEAEIQTDMNKTLTGSETGLTALWQPSSFTTGKIYDKTPNAGHVNVIGFNKEQTLEPTFISSKRIDLEWSTIPGATQYRLTKNGGAVYTGTDQTIQETNLNEETDYTYGITASNADGEKPIVVKKISTLPAELAISSTPVIEAFQGTVLNGERQVVSTNITGNLQISDFTDSGSGWNVQVQATPFKEKTPYGGFTSGTKPLVIPSGSLKIKPISTITPVAGTNSPSPAIGTNVTSVLDDGNAVVLLTAAVNEGMGSYDATFPTNALTLTLQPNDIRIDDTNYSSSSTPFSSVVTWTISAGP